MQNRLLRRPILISLGMLFLAMLACGGFQVRVTPTLTPPPTATTPPTPGPVATTPAPTTTAVRLTPIPTTAPSPTATAAKPGLAVGKSARVSASGGVNVREKATTASKLLGKLDPGVIVTISAGPTTADDYTWWQVDNGKGLVGWVAAGTRDDPWLQPETGSGAAAGGGKLVNRPVRLGDRVQVTTDDRVLTVRETAGKDGLAVARAVPGTQFTVRGGPVRQDGYLWWQLEGEQVRGWAAEGEEGDRWLTPVEP